MPVALFDYQGLQEEFKDVLQGRWVPQENLHLTLRFFGETYEKELLIETLSSLPLLAKTSELKGLSLLSGSNVLYARTQDDTLFSLNAQLRDALLLPCEEEFIPHVTLMRVKKVLNQTILEQRLRAYDTKVIGTLLPKIQLMQSLITPTGSQYTLLKEF